MTVKERKPRTKKFETIVYVVLRLIVIGIMVRGIMTKNVSEVVYCVLTLILFMLPSIVERGLKIDLPSTLEIIVLLFIFAAEILGEVGQFFERVKNWDLILHTTNGFLMAAIGIALIDVLNRSPKINLSMSPFFVAFVAFCFSMTIGVLWEFYEYTADRWFGKDMQKDTTVTQVISEEFNPDGLKPAMVVTDITQTVVYGTVGGEETAVVLDGYVDIGLYDTMEDLFVNLIGALTFSIIGALYVKRKGKGQVADAFIPKMLMPEEVRELEELRADRRKKLKNRLGISQVGDAAGETSDSVSDHLGE